MKSFLILLLKLETVILTPAFWGQYFNLEDLFEIKKWQMASSLIHFVLFLAIMTIYFASCGNFATPRSDIDS